MPGTWDWELIWDMSFLDKQEIYIDANGEERVKDPLDIRIDIWREKIYNAHYERYGVHLTDGQIDAQYENLINNPLFKKCLQLQNFWLMKTWFVRNKLFHTFWQDLNDDKRYWFHGRRWIYLLLGRDHELSSVPCLYLSWAIPDKSFALEMAIGGEDREIKFSISIPPISLWIGIHNIINRKFNEKINKYDHPRYTGIRIFANTIWLNFLHDDSGWGDWRGWEKSLNLADLLFGRTEYLTEEIRKGEASIYLPEGKYDLKCRLYWGIWTRPRFPGKRWVKRCEIEPVRPIPIPGKGENSWDDGENASFGCTLMARSINDAVSQYLASINETRLKYGGKDWLPEKISN